MIIVPIRNKIRIEVEEGKIGNLDITVHKPIYEYGKVVAIGKDVKDIKVGDELFFKSWALDIITRNKKTYYFISEDSDAICAIVHE